MLWIFRLSSSRAASTLTNVGFQIKRLNDQKEYRKALDLFNIRSVQEQANPVATNQALRAWIAIGDFKSAIRLHQGLSAFLLKNNFIRTTLIRLYLKSGDIRQAEEIFLESEPKSSAMYATILTGLLENDRAEEALHLFQRMDLEPNEYLLSIVCKICAKLADDRALKYGRELFQSMPKKYQDNPIIITSMLHMLLACGDIGGAKEFFKKTPKNIFAFGAMMTGFVSNKMSQQAIDLFFQIREPNEVIYGIFFQACAQLESTEGLKLGKKIFDQLSDEYRRSTRVIESVLNLFVKCGDEKSAESLFQQMNRNKFSFASMMKLAMIKDSPEQTLVLFEQMKREKIQADEIIFTLLIDACSTIGDLTLSESILSQMPKQFLSDRWIENALIDLWGKVGDVERAKQAFRAVQRRDTITFTNMINAFGFNGKGREAVELFRQIPSSMIDSRMNVCVLNACSHSGLIEQAEKIFHEIPAEQRSDRIYTTMVDTFSRAARFGHAQSLIDQYESSHSPSLPMHMALLSGARNQKNSVLSQMIFDRIQLLFPDAKLSRTAATILLANTYASQENLTKASALRLRMNRSGVKKTPGVSYTVVNGQIVRFRAHDRSHPRSDEILAESNRLLEELIEHGYKADGSWITRPLMNDERKEEVLCGHSERLAIAFNFIQRPAPARIQVTTNLRMCGDCHAAIKLIARVRCCLIVVRDASRIHHFYPNGQCSCGDYF